MKVTILLPINSSPCFATAVVPADCWRPGWFPEEKAFRTGVDWTLLENKNSSRKNRCYGDKVN